MQSFEKMLDKLFLVLEEDPTENKLRIGQPIFKRESKNKIWVNAKNYLQTINRDPDHFIIFMNKETNGVANWKTSHKSDGIVLSSKTKDNNIISLNLFLDCHLGNMSLLLYKTLFYIHQS